MFGPRDVALSPVLPAAFLELDDAKAYMGVTDTADDLFIGALCDAASVAIEGYCNTIFYQRTVTETMFPSEPITNLVLAHSPVIELQSLIVDDVDKNVDDYFLMKAVGTIRHDEGDQISGRKIEVIYDAGYATIPEPVIEAAREFVKFIYQNRSLAAAIGSESIAGVGAITYRSSDDVMKGPTGGTVPGTVGMMLAPYVRSFSP